MQSEQTQSEQTRLSIDSETIKEIVDMFMTVRQFIPLIEPVAASVLTTYRDIKGGEHINELLTEWKDDFLGFCYRMNEICVQQDIKAINAYKAAGISEDNAVALRCARAARKIPEIKINAKAQ